MNIQPPAQIGWLVADVGEDAALCFIESAGGSRIWVPRKWAGSDLCNTYGEDIARSLSNHYGGEQIEVPICRHWRIQMYRQMNLTIDQIAVRAGATRRWVKKVLENGPWLPRTRRESWRTDPGQLNLF